MPINHLKFLKIFLDKYSRQYPDMPVDLISDIIGTTLIESPAVYFDYNLVQEHPEFCKKCGACCKQRNVKCKHFNGRTCDDYYNRGEECAEFPFYDIDGEMGLWLDTGCNFAKKLAELKLDEQMKEYYENFFRDEDDDSRRNVYPQMQNSDQKL